MLVQWLISISTVYQEKSLVNSAYSTIKNHFLPHFRTKLPGSHPFPTVHRIFSKLQAPKPRRRSGLEAVAVVLVGPQCLTSTFEICNLQLHYFLPCLQETNGPSCCSLSSANAQFAQECKPSGQVALVPHWVGLPTHRWHATIVTGRQAGLVDVMARARVYFDGTHMVMARFEMGYQLAHCYFSCTKAIFKWLEVNNLRQILAHHIQRHVFFRVPSFPGGLDRRSTLQRTRSGWDLAEGLQGQIMALRGF